MCLPAAAVRGWGPGADLSAVARCVQLPRRERADRVRPPAPVIASRQGEQKRGQAVKHLPRVHALEINTPDIPAQATAHGPTPSPPPRPLDLSSRLNVERHRSREGCNTTCCSFNKMVEVYLTFNTNPNLIRTLTGPPGKFPRKKYGMKR